MEFKWFFGTSVRYYGSVRGSPGVFGGFRGLPESIKGVSVDIWGFQRISLEFKLIYGNFRSFPVHLKTFKEAMRD